MLHAELFDRWANVLKVENPLLQNALQEDDHNSDLPILLHLGRANTAALLHATLDKEKSEFFWEVYVLLNSIEDLK